MTYCCGFASSCAIETIEGRLALARWKSARSLGDTEGDERATP